MRINAPSLRALARADVDSAIGFLLQEAGERSALRFIDDLERTYAEVVRHPGAGSPRYGDDLNIPGLRTRQLRHLPYLVFYFHDAGEVDVWRVLHGQRDLKVVLLGG